MKNDKLLLILLACDLMLNQNEFPTYKPREHLRVSQTALHHMAWRSYYGIPYAEEMARLTRAREETDEKFGLAVARDIIPTMEARYKGGQAAMEEFIKEHPNAQVLELAAGFSLHGLTLAQKHPGINYYETDYSPEIAAQKQQLVEQGLLSGQLPNLTFARADALDLASLEKALENADPKRPLLIYCEGLITYLNDEEKQNLIENIITLLKRFGGKFITPDPGFSRERQRKLAETVPAFRPVAKNAEDKAGREYKDNGFESEAIADEFFNKNTLDIQKFPQPVDLNSFKACGVNDEMARQLVENIKAHGKVWMLKLKN